MEDNFLPKRIHHNDNITLRELVVGETHVAAIDGNGIRWWRADRNFPTSFPGVYSSLTSGAGFTCAIDVKTSFVTCWGLHGLQIQAIFANERMLDVVAGESQICGITMHGHLLCGGGNYPKQSNSLSSSLEIKLGSLTLGANHICAIWRENSTVVCWGAGGDKYFPAINTKFDFVVASGNMTCGLKSNILVVLCWWAKLNAATIMLPQQKVLPGICSSHWACPCGYREDSVKLCAFSLVICQRCEWQPPVTKKINEGWLAFAIQLSVTTLVVLCWILYRYYKKSSSTGIHRPESQVGLQQNSQRSFPSSSNNQVGIKFSFVELSAATDNFALDNKIGMGSCGTVYKGKLRNSCVVAIKRIESGPRMKKPEDMESLYQNELTFLSHLRHKHLVGFVGYCKEGDERLLVSEYMINGSLYDHLHQNGDRGGSTFLNSWEIRIKLLLDAARGVQYLHSYAVPPILHRDIKSANILLDEKWIARVSDFGLSLRGLELEDGQVYMDKMAGTVGYVDPEFWNTHHLTLKSDVYSFGIVMLEVLTGKKAIFMPNEARSPVTIVDYVVPFIDRGEISKVLDARVDPPWEHEVEALELVAYTAAHCVKPEQSERPIMTDVITNLERALSLETFSLDNMLPR